MKYPAEAIPQLKLNAQSAIQGLIEVQVRCTRAGQMAEDGRVKEHLSYGASRRLQVLRRAISNVFKLFPLEQETPLPFDVLTDVQINLHAFTINLYGAFENLAWAYVLQKGLLEEIGDFRRVGMFSTATQRHLPAAVREWLENPEMEQWRLSYLKSYRDALAHRIPLYIPPSEVTSQDVARLRELEQQCAGHIENLDLDALEAAQLEQRSIGTPSFQFLHAIHPDEAAQPVLMHPQLVCDALTITAFSNVFFDNWKQ